MTERKQTTDGTHKQFRLDGPERPHPAYLYEGPPPCDSQVSFSIGNWPKPRRLEVVAEKIYVKQKISKTYEIERWVKDNQNDTKRVDSASCTGTTVHSRGKTKGMGRGAGAERGPKKGFLCAFMNINCCWSYFVRSEKFQTLVQMSQCETNSGSNLVFS